MEMKSGYHAILLAALFAPALPLQGCAGSPGRTAENTAVVCRDLADNDGDGLVDCDDDECRLFRFCGQAAPGADADMVAPAREVASGLDLEADRVPALEDAAATDSSPEADVPPVVEGGDAPFVPAPPAAPATRWVSPDGNDDGPGTKEQPWRQLSHAAEMVQPGDVVEILDGTYQAPIILAGKQGGNEQPIVFRATGGAALVDGAGADGSAWDKRDAIYIYESSHIIIHGLRVTGAHRAGLRVSLAQFITIQGCIFGDNGTWGIFTDFADDLSLLGNECFGSKAEHGIYHSNSGDRAVIAGNYCHHNHACGIQLNADPSNGGDGIHSDCVVVRNLLVSNNQSGGAAINLASVRDSVIRNNLAYGNLATGIGMWDDGQGQQWGCRDNLVEHNTIVFQPGEGRFGITIWNGSTGNQVRNNLFVSGARGGISFTEDSLEGLESDYNLYFSRDGWHLFEEEHSQKQYDVDQFNQLTGGDGHSLTEEPQFVDAPGGDYRLQPGSPGHDGGVDSGVTQCYDGTPRPKGAGYDMGALDN